MLNQSISHIHNSNQSHNSIYSCHSDKAPNRNKIVYDESNKQCVKTTIVVQDGYITPHPLLASNECPELNRTPRYRFHTTAWLPIACGHMTSDRDNECAGCKHRIKYNSEFNQSNQPMQLELQF